MQAAVPSPDASRYVFKNESIPPFSPYHVKVGVYNNKGESFFGPVTTIVRVKGDEEAIRVANDTEYGLSSAVFSNNLTRAMAAASRIQAGCVHINGATVQNEPQAPYGGMKNSGYGRFDGRAVIEEFTEIKWVTLEDPRQAYPF